MKLEQISCCQHIHCLLRAVFPGFMESSRWGSSLMGAIPASLEAQDRWLCCLHVWAGDEVQKVTLSSLLALRSATQSSDRVNSTVWSPLSTDCSWNMLWQSGTRLVLRFQRADASEFPSAHLPRQWAGLGPSSVPGTTAKLDPGWTAASSWERC